MKLSEHLTLTGGVGIAVAAVMILLLPLVLPKGERGRTKLPLILLLLYVAIVASRSFLDDDSPSHEPLKVAGVFFLGSSMARSGFLLVLHSVITRTLGGNVPRIVRDLVQALLFMGVLMLTLRAAGVEPSSLLTTSALLTAVIGLSLQDTLGNLFAGLAIQAQRPFRVGDWIQYDDTEHHIGRIVEMNWRAVKVETLDKVEMTVPNATLAKSSLQNYSMPTRVARRHAYVEAPYDRPPERVIPQLVDAVRGVAGVL
ncbi:MAG TPA: mechanosensitive ion channel, partial [Polyangiaceae bacterium LLY-WYZ-15_(1-7)]|nr:mechanosensitive ion channel [Polyangiaceae bacterium LLY-WYZ-15_(1-7)]